MHGVHIDPLAEDDLAKVISYYELARLGLGDEFMLEFRTLLSRIAGNPFLYQAFHGGRTALMNRFPYVVLYRFDSETIFILGILHGSRNPRSIAKRFRTKNN